MAMAPSAARADVVISEKDGWRFSTTGLIAAHFQYIAGDGDPATTHGVLIGGQFIPEGAEDNRDNSLKLSRIRSGFIGTQIGFGVGRQISESVRVDSLLSISVNDISSNRHALEPKNVDYREAWALVSTPYGGFKFGRMFSIFGSASAPVVLLAYRYGIGNPCLASGNTIACASVGAGPLFAGYQAQFRYITPRVAGLELQLAVSDPVVTGSTYHITRLPRFDGELNFDRQFGPTARLRVIAQGMTEKLQRIDQTQNLATATVWGVMGGGIIDVSGFSIGGAAWTGSGISNRNVVESPDANNPLAYDSTGELRMFRGYFGNVAYDYHGTALAAGGGITHVKATPHDSDENSQTDVLDRSFEYHLVFTQRFDALVLVAEVMKWTDQWHFGEKRSLTFGGVGANYAW